MQTETIKFFEQLLRDYVKTNDYIEKRTSELNYTIREDNQSHVLSHYLNNRNQGLRICISEDQRLIQLRINQACITYCLAHSDEVTVSIIHELYFLDYPHLTLEGVGQKIGLSRASVSKRRTAFFKMMARELGY